MSTPEQIEKAKEAKANPKAKILAFIVAEIEKSDDALLCCSLARSAEPAFRNDWGGPLEDTPEEFAHYQEREKVFGALARKLEKFFPGDEMHDKNSVGYLELILGVMPTGGFTSCNEGGQIPARIATIRERLYARIGRLTLRAKMAEVE